MIIFKLFGEQILRKLKGERIERKLERVFARITKNIPSAPGRSDYIRVRLFEKEGEWWAEPIIGKSGLITTLSKVMELSRLVQKKREFHRVNTYL